MPESALLADGLKRLTTMTSHSRSMPRMVAGLVERKAVDGDADERQGFAVENEIGGMLCIGIRTHVHGVDDARAVGVKVKLQMHRVDQMGRRAVVGAEDGFCHLCSQYVDAAEHVRR